MPQRLPLPPLDSEIDSFLSSLSQPKPAGPSLDSEIDGFLSSLTATPAPKPTVLTGDRPSRARDIHLPAPTTGPSFNEIAEAKRGRTPITPAFPGPQPSDALVQQAAQPVRPPGHRMTPVTPTPEPSLVRQAFDIAMKANPVAQGLDAAAKLVTGATAGVRALPTAVGEATSGHSLPGHEGEDPTFVGRLMAHAKMIAEGQAAAVAPMGPVRAFMPTPDTVAHTEDIDKIAMGTYGTDVIPTDRVRSRAEMVALETGRRGLDMVAQLFTDPVAVATMGAQGVKGAILAAAFGVEGIKSAAAVAQDPNATPEDVAEAAVGVAVATIPGAARVIVPKFREAVWKVADKTRAMADAVEAQRHAGRTITPDPTDIAVIPERQQLPAEAPIAGTPVTPRQPRSPQEPPTYVPPVAVRPGVSEAVGPVAPSPGPTPVAAAAAPATSLDHEIDQTIAAVAGPEFVPVGTEPPAPARGTTPITSDPTRRDAPIDTTDPTKAAQQMLEENPNIIRQGAELGQRTRDSRMEAPPRTPVEAAQPPAPHPHVSTGYDTSSLTTAERRELRRMHAEIENLPFVKRTFREAGVGKGGGREVTAGAGGAPVFHDITGSTRAAVAEAVRRILDGKAPNAAGKRAIDVARHRVKDDGTVTPPSLPLEAGESGVPPEAGPKDIRTRANARVADPSDLDFLARRYDERRDFGNVVSRDNAKELFYRTDTLAERTALNDAVSDAAGKVAEAAYARRLTEPTGHDATVILTSGGTGSGKTSVGTQTERAQYADVVFDSQGTDVAAMTRRIQQARASGRTVEHVYVYRDPIDAWLDGVMPRTETTGRPVSIDGHIASHGGAAKATLEVATAHAADPGYRLTVIDNTAEQARELPRVDGRDFLAAQAEAYNGDSAQETIRGIVDAAYAEGLIPDDVYDAYVDRRAGGGRPAEDREGREPRPDTPEVSEAPAGPVSERRPVQPTEEVGPTEGERGALAVIRRHGFDVEAYDESRQEWVLSHGDVSDAMRSSGGRGRRAVPDDVARAFETIRRLSEAAGARLINETPTAALDREIDTFLEDVLDTGEVQTRLPGAESARQVGKADTTFKAPQQASGDDFVLGTEETPEAKATREAAERGPSMFDETPAVTPAKSEKQSTPVTPVADAPAAISHGDRGLDAKGIWTVTALNLDQGRVVISLPRRLTGKDNARVVTPAQFLAMRAAFNANKPATPVTTRVAAKPEEAQNGPDERPGPRESRLEAETSLGGVSAQGDGAATARGATGQPPVRPRAANAESGSDAAPAGYVARSGAGDDARDRVSTGGGRQRTRAVGTDYRIATDDPLGDLPDSRKIADNLAALRLLKTLDTEARKATPEEQRTLVRYVGWGGLASTFKPHTPDHAKLRELVDSGTITEAEFAAMRASTPNAHYTSRTVISAMYDAVARLGLTGGRVLEPSTGAGHFFGLMPDALANNTTWAGVELDKVTARIAQHLYQSANIQAAGFEDARIPVNFFDLAIGNPPFGNYAVHDPKFTGARKFLTSALHNYFFAKSLDAVRPGGLVAFVTSHYTMDAKDSGVRRYLDQQAELLGAIRLPNTAFKRNAGTEVVTDIIFLKKRAEPKIGEPSAWVTADELDLDGGRGHDDRYRKLVNRYFIENPRMVLGRHATTGSMYSDKEYTVEPTGDLAEQLGQAVKLLPEGVITPAPKPKATEPSTADLIPAPGHVKPFAFTVHADGKLYVRDGENLVSQEGLPDTTKARIRGLMGLRDGLRTTMRAMLDPDASDATVKAAQKHLNTVYDTFVKKHGFLTTRGNILAFGDDPDKPLLLSLEEWDPEMETAKKAPIFTKRVLSPRKPVTSADSPKSALMIALNENGRVDWDRMSALTGQTAEQLQQALSGVVYETPGGAWLTADDYLSGNVRAKLAEAETAAAVDARFQANVEALEKVQPEDLGPKDIDARLGAPWIPPADIEAFITHITGGRARVRYVPPLAAWTVQPTQFGGLQKYNATRKGALDLIELSLNLKLPTVYDKGPNNTSVVNPKDTLEARSKQQDIKDEFKRWLWEDTARGQRLARFYNDHFNNLRLRTYDGSHLTLPGMAVGITLRPHQTNGIWRALTSGNTLFAHVVGAGKTFAMIGTAMEMRRLGLAKKPLITVPNHLVEQWGAEFNRMYPTAKVLIATKKDFESERRKRLMSRIATGDWDAVIVAHSSFTRVPVSDDTFIDFIQKQIDVLEQYIEEEKAATGKKGRSVKEIEKAKKRLEAKLKDRRDRERQDDTVEFEDLGVDALFVDEAHMFKNLWFPTKMTRVAGLPNSESDRAFDMYLKTQYVQKVTNGRGVVFATGTPISNTMAEMFTMQRYLGGRQLEENGLSHFDAWAQQFGEVVAAMELAPEGKGYRVRNRFAKFTNFAELAKLFRSFADVQTADMLNLPTPRLKGGKPTLTAVKASPALTQYVESLVRRADALRRTKVDPRIDNMLKITGDGRKAALDLRLVGLSQPPGGKLDVAAESIVKTYKATTKVKGTQLVFSDLGTPKAKGATPVTAVDADDSGFNVYEALREKLVTMGIPKKEIAFIHDANTDARKLTLFNDVNAGRVRVLIGSTEKMGAGTNVQKRLVKKHDLDAPWRPSDVEQRDGRIIRQGNDLWAADPDGFEVEIERYLAEGSFDAYMWQTLETKAKFINKAMSGDITGRSVEDVDVVMISSAAQAKAIASGNPMVFEKVKIDAEVATLLSLRSSWEQSRWELRNDLAMIPKLIEGRQRDLADLDAMQAAVKLPDPWTVTVGKKSYGERKEGGERLIGAARKVYMDSRARGRETIGRFAGLDVLIGTYDNPKKDDLILVLLGDGDATIDIGHINDNADPLGWAARLLNGVGRIEEEIANKKADIAYREKRLADAKARENDPWEKQAQLDAALKEQERLDKALDLDAASQAKQAPAAAADDGDGDGVDSMSNQPPNQPLPRRGTPVTPTDAMKPSAIIKKLRKGLGDIPVSVGRFKQQSIAVYKRQPEAIRTRVANDVQAIAHEFGHHVTHTLLDISKRDKRWRDELQGLGQATSRPSYNVAQQRNEGTAEFFRLYLIEPDRARAEAPNYFTEFERQLNDQPDLKKVLHDARADLAGLMAQDPATRGMMRMDFSGHDSDGIYRRLKDDPKGEMRHLATLWIDDLHALRVAVDQMRDARPLDARENAYTLARNARGTGGQAEGFLEFGVRGRNGRFLSVSFADAITPVKDHLRDFAAYLTARRVLEVQALKGKETGMTADEARGIIRQVEGGPQAAEMARARDNVYAYQQGLLQYAREYGALSPEQLKTLSKEVNYVPLQRVRDVVGAAFQDSAKKIANRSTPIKRMRGSGRDIINPLESIVKNTFAIVDMVEKNRAMRALVRQAEKSAGSARWLERVPTPQVATKFNLSQVTKDVRAELEDMGLELPDNFDLDAFVKVFTPANFATPGQNLVTVIRNGERQFWEVHDQPLYDAVLAIGGTATSKLIEWASKPAALLRAGATLTPGFIARNPTRDTLVAFMQSRYGFIPVYDTLRGFLSLALGDEDAKLFFTSGIQQSSLVGADRDRVRKMLRDMPESSTRAFFKNVVLHPIDMLRALSENMESATRLGEFRLALNAGGEERRAGLLGIAQRLTTPVTRATDDETLTRATLAARDVTTDFSRAGIASREMNRIYAFFNARIQGYVRMAETAARDPIGTTLNATALALLSYFLWWAHSDDDEYAEIPDWEKSAYWHIPTPKGYIKVAKPFEWAYLANVTEAALEYIQKKNPDGLNRIKPETDPTKVAYELIPSALLPVLEAAFNYDTFRDTHIVKPWDVGLQPDQQKSDWTTNTAIQLGKVMNVSPAKLDHIIFGYGAGFARGVVEHGTDPVLRILRAAPTKSDPVKKWQRTPVVGTFYREGTYDGGSQSLRDFYEEYERVISGERSVSRYRTSGETAAGRAFLEKTADERWRVMGPQIKAAKQELENLGDVIDAIYAAPPSAATPEQKRAALDRVYERMVDVARRGLGKQPRRGATPVTPAAAGGGRTPVTAR